MHIRVQYIACFDGNTQEAIANSLIQKSYGILSFYTLLFRWHGGAAVLFV